MYSLNDKKYENKVILKELKHSSKTVKIRLNCYCSMCLKLFN